MLSGRSSTGSCAVPKERSCAPFRRSGIKATTLPRRAARIAVQRSRSLTWGQIRCISVDKRASVLQRGAPSRSALLPMHSQTQIELSAGHRLIGNHCLVCDFAIGLGGSNRAWDQKAESTHRSKGQVMNGEPRLAYGHRVRRTLSFGHTRRRHVQDVQAVRILFKCDQVIVVVPAELINRRVD
jgi:hypothetical protein